VIKELEHYLPARIFTGEARALKDLKYQALTVAEKLLPRIFFYVYGFGALISGALVLAALFLIVW
jgi:hypothetical protein